MAGVDVVVIGRSLDPPSVLNGISHGQAWGIMGISLWAGLLVCSSTDSLWPMSLPAASVVWMAAMSNFAQRQRELEEKDREDDGAGT